MHARALAVPRLQEVLPRQLDDEQPHVLDVHADERARRRRVHQGPERRQQGLLDAVLHEFREEIIWLNLQGKCS